jgi:hypothetical protein
VIVSTGLGSTGWLKSLVAGATGVADLVNVELGKAPPARHAAVDPTFPWDARHLFFTVREPFPSRNTGTTLLFGRVTEQQPLIIESQMSESGVIFSDGIEADFLEFNSGTRATITLAEKRGCLVV